MHDLLVLAIIDIRVSCVFVPTDKRSTLSSLTNEAVLYSAYNLS